MYLFYAQELVLKENTNCFVVEKKEDNRWKMIGIETKLKEGEQTHEEDIELVGKTIIRGLFVSFSTMQAAITYARIHLKILKNDTRILRCLIKAGKAWTGTDLFRDKDLFGSKSITKIEVLHTYRTAEYL